MNEHGIMRGIIFTSTADGKQSGTQTEIVFVDELMY